MTGDDWKDLLAASILGSAAVGTISITLWVNSRVGAVVGWALLAVAWAAWRVARRYER